MLLDAFRGRINRKTFILGNLIGLAVLGFAALIYIVPVAIVDIVVKGSEIPFIFKFLYALFLIPILFYLFYFSVLFVRRMHDIGYPGMLILWITIGLQVIWRLMDVWGLNILGLIIVLLITLIPGKKDRNSFGPRPGKKFKLENIVIRF